MPERFTPGELATIQEVVLGELESMAIGENDINDLDLETLPVHQFEGHESRIQNLQAIAKKARNKLL